MNLNDMWQRNVGDGYVDTNDIFNPSMVYNLLKDPFGVWCDYFAPKNMKEEETEYINQLLER